jgi:hypothetical protein
VSRVLTTILQLFLVGGAIILGKMMWNELKYDIQETILEMRNK